MQKWLHRELYWGLVFNNVCDCDFLKILSYTNWVQLGQTEDSQQSNVTLTRDYASAEQQLQHGRMFSAQSKYKVIQHECSGTWLNYRSFGQSE